MEDDSLDNKTELVPAYAPTPVEELQLVSQQCHMSKFDGFEQPELKLLKSEQRVRKLSYC